MENIGGVEVKEFAEGQVTIFDNPLGVKLYAEGPHNIFVASGVVSISLFAPRSDPTGKLYRTIVERIRLLSTIDIFVASLLLSERRGIR